LKSYKQEIEMFLYT